MLIILTERQHRTTFSRWLEHFSGCLKDCVQMIPYEQVSGRMPGANYLFADLERLSRSSRRLSQMIDFSDRVKGAGFKVFNAPDCALMRYDLQQKLGSDFRTYRSSEDYSSVRLPAFVRLEHDHRTISGLLWSLDEIKAAIPRRTKCLVCEFYDTSSSGLYHKFSSFLINGRVIPRHKIFSRHWEVKIPDVENEATLGEEAEYCRTNPHRKEIERVFRLARIDFGRIDYSEVDGRLHVWEINTNPTMKPVPSRRGATRDRIFSECAAAVNAELREMSRATARKPKYINASFYPRALFSESYARELLVKARDSLRK